MKRKRTTEEQIVAVLREHEAGVKTAGDRAKTFRCSKGGFTAGQKRNRLALVPGGQARTGG